MLLTLDGTFLIQMLNFVVFWALLNYLFIAPTRKAIVARQQFIAKQFGEADELRAVADSLRAEADKVLDEARRQTHAVMREASAEAEQSVRSIENRAMEESNAIVALAQATVVSERTAALEKQKPFIEELARTMVERATSLDWVA